MKTKIKKYDIALVATPWWLIPSENIVTATEHLVQDYAYNLKKEGYKSVIFSRAKDGTDSEGIKDCNGYKNEYKYIRVGLMDRKVFRKSNSLYFYLLYALKLSIQIRKLGVKKIIVFQTFPFCFWIKLLNKDCKLLFYTVNHELSKNENYFEYGFIPDKLANTVNPKIDGIIAMSKYIKDGILRRFPCLKEKCKNVYPGIDIGVFKQGVKGKKAKIIIYSGRVVPEKGVHLLVNAFNSLKKDFENIQLYILGDVIGPNVPDNYVDILNTEGVRSFGLLTRKEVAKILERSSIFVYPVIWEEPFGLAPMEAMAAGLPTVVSDGNSGYLEVINQKNGYYFKSGDKKDLERVLRNLLSSSKGQKEVCDNAINTVKRRLSWKECIKNTIDVFSSSEL
jgi:glycosyltransferase involved in cell wall biosynthesis